MGSVKPLFSCDIPFAQSYNTILVLILKDCLAKRGNPIVRVNDIIYALIISN